jgi:hypothetical protein
VSLLKAKTSKTRNRNIEIENALIAATEEDIKRINVNLPKSVYKKFKAKTNQNEISISSLIRQWVDDYISGEE